jgi:3-hexulose-6-phosphate synthase
MDAGEYEARSAFMAGARYVTVLGVTDLLTVKACLEVAVKFDGVIVVDMICVQDLPSKIAELESIGVRALAAHTGVDQQAAGRTPAQDLAVMKQHSERCEIFVAGGVNSKNIREYMRLGADVAVVGGGICRASDPVGEARLLSKLARGLA